MIVNQILCDEARKAAKQAIKAWEKRCKADTEYREGRTLTFGNYVFDYINEYCVQERRIKGVTILQYNRDYKSYIQKYSISRQQLQNLSKDVFNDNYAKLAEKYAEKSIHGAAC